VFRPEQPIDQVMLAMALAANDLISSRLVLQQLHLGAPAEWRDNAYDGARMGMVLWCNRMMASIVHEVLNLVKEKHDLLASDPDFARALRELSDSGCADWDGIVAMATDEAEKGDRKFLELIRHNLTSHYYQPKALAAGYRRAFFEAGLEKTATYAYLSTSEYLAGTRFYFVDAAIQVAGANFHDKTREEGSSGWVEHMEGITSMLVVLVVAFLGPRLDALKAQQSSAIPADSQES
jgi:hypothetical protein